MLEASGGFMTQKEEGYGELWILVKKFGQEILNATM
jgi:hypothetical protein